MQYITVPQAAKLANVTEDTIRRWIKTGRITGVVRFPGAKGEYRVPENFMTQFEMEADIETAS